MNQLQQISDYNMHNPANMNNNCYNQILPFRSDNQNHQINQFVAQSQQISDYNMHNPANMNNNCYNQILPFRSDNQNHQINQFMTQSSDMQNQQQQNTNIILNPIFNPLVYSDVSHLKNTSHLTYEKIKSQLEYKHSFLKSVSSEQFKDQCQTVFSYKSFETLHDPFENFVEKSHISINSLTQNKLPNYNNRHGQWSQTDTNLLISVIKEGMSIGSILNERGEIMWDVVSQYMFGRDSLSCKNKWNHLKGKKDPRIEKITKDKSIPVSYTHMTLPTTPYV